MSPRKAAETSVGRASGKASSLLSAEERAAMRETLNERRRARSGQVDGESDVLAKIAEMPKQDRVMPSGSTLSSKPTLRLLFREPGTGCPLMRRTARLFVSSRAARNSSRDTPRSVFNKMQNWMRVIFGQPPLP
jgi:hypothetical protein